MAPQWIVPDVAKTVQYYCDLLGFQVDWIGDPPLFAIISRDGMILMLRQLKEDGFARPNRIPFIKSGWQKDGVDAWDAYVWVTNADELHEEFVKSGVHVIKSISNTDYGNRDFQIEDPNGYILCFGHMLA